MSVELRNTHTHTHTHIYIYIYINLVAKSDKRKTTKRHVSRWKYTIKMVFVKYDVDQLVLLRVLCTRCYELY
jgi:hypothetical protein